MQRKTMDLLAKFKLFLRERNQLLIDERSRQKLILSRMNLHPAQNGFYGKGQSGAHEKNFSQQMK